MVNLNATVVLQAIARRLAWTRIPTVFVALNLLVVLSVHSYAAPQVSSGPLVINGQNGTVIENLKITSATGDCLTIIGSANIVIRNSEIGPCRGNGIVISGGTGINIVDNYIHPEHTSITSCCDTGDGIYGSNTANILIQGNVIAYGESNIEMVHSNGINVIGNFLLNPYDYGGSRGANFQAWTNSSGILVENNYALSSRDTSIYKFPENQSDSISFGGGTTGIVARNNYITGGHDDHGCGLIVDSGANNAQFLNNTLLDTGQCGIAVTDGVNQVVSGNRILNRTPTPDGGNTALVVWKVYPTDPPCGPVSITNNIAYEVKPNGYLSGYWNGGGCEPVTATGNLWDQAAYNALVPVSQNMPAPMIPPQPSACVATSPYSNQTAWPTCNGSSDTIPPTVSFSAPADGQTVSGIVGVAALASDNVGVVGVQFLLDGSALGAEVLSPPYTTNWNSTTAANASHALAAVARDAAGNNSTATIHVTTNNAAVPLVVPTAGLVTWLRADAGIVTQGSRVSRWSDQSGSNNDATQTIGSSQPVLVNSATGAPAVRFDGASASLSFPLSIENLNGLTIFLVGGNAVDRTGGASESENAAVFWDESVWWGTTYLSPFQSSVKFRFGTTQVGNLPAYTRPSSIGSNFSLTVSKKDGSTDSLYVNGAFVYSESGKIPAIHGSTVPGYLGRGYGPSYFAGDIAEVLIYSRALTDIERQSVEQYLMSKYFNSTSGAVW